MCPKKSSVLSLHWTPGYFNISFQLCFGSLVDTILVCIYFFLDRVSWHMSVNGYVSLSQHAPGSNVVSSSGGGGGEVDTLTMGL